MTYNIVNIRGTSGSGKTTVVTRLLEEWKLLGVPLGPAETRVIQGKERRIGHLAGSLFIVGRYDTTCGGCDTMSWKGAADDVCDLVREKYRFGPVLFEGLMVSGWGTGRLRSLWEETEQKLHVIQLTTPLEECLNSVNTRRQEAYARKLREKPGVMLPPLKPLNPENTTAKWHGTMRGSELLKKSGVPVEFLDREAAYQRAKELLA